jgi:nitric oxide reductase NorQ protein
MSHEIKSLLQFTSLARLNGALVQCGMPPQSVKTRALDDVVLLVANGHITVDDVKLASPYDGAVRAPKPVTSSGGDIVALQRTVDELTAKLSTALESTNTALTEVASLDERICLVAESRSASDPTTIRHEVAKLFDSFKTAHSPEEMTAIADSLPVATSVMKVKDVFKGQKLSYTFGTENVDFSNMDVFVYKDDAPTCLDDYVFNPQHLHSALIALHAPNIPINTWLGGERSTGKTEFVTQLANRLGRKLYRINFDEAMERAEFIGGDSVKDGTVFWREGILTKAIQHSGAIVLLDELSFARPNALATLHSIVEPNPNRGLNIAETGKKISVKRDVVFFVADNTLGYGDSSGSFHGTREMNTALLDRFGFKLKFEYLNADDETKLLANRIGIHKEVARAMVQFANSARQKVASGVLTQPPSLRSLQAWAIGVKSGLPVQLAFTNAIIRSYPEDCHAELLAIYTAMIDVSKLKSYI